MVDKYGISMEYLLNNKLKYIINIIYYRQMEYFTNYKTSKHYYSIYNRYLKCGEYQKYIDNSWKLDGLYHNFKGSAIIYVDGTQEWWVNGKLHREGDLPAIIYTDSTKMWYKYGKLHREGDLPAIIYSDGTQVWYINGKRHREGDLPAVIYVDNTQIW
jgi:ribosomal protein L25 (general stress protein Ctc)